MKRKHNNTGDVMKKYCPACIRFIYIEGFENRKCLDNSSWWNVENMLLRYVLCRATYRVCSTSIPAGSFSLLFLHVASVQFIYLRISGVEQKAVCFKCIFCPLVFLSYLTNSVGFLDIVPVLKFFSNLGNPRKPHQGHCCSEHELCASGCWWGVCVFCWRDPSREFGRSQTF